MASLLRRIVAGPRAEHAETGLDLCYVTPSLIATSGPSQSYPQLAYRNPLDRLVAYLDKQHGTHWAIWEFRAEGTGYPDEAVHGRIRHYPWPDHHPPPFRLVPLIVASMRQWLDGGDDDGSASAAQTATRRVVVVHCKAGKGRSGTMACSYLIAECGWSAQQALARFTERRMRPGFGPGVSIPSQLRWIGYVERWARQEKRRREADASGRVGVVGLPYRDRAVEIVEIHVWGLRHGVKLAVEGYVDEGKKIHMFHTFTNDERIVVQGDAPGGGGWVDFLSDMAGARSRNSSRERQDRETGLETPARHNTDDLLASHTHHNASAGPSALPQRSQTAAIPASFLSPSTAPASAASTASTVSPATSGARHTFPGGRSVVFRPQTPVRVPNSDVNIDLERRHKAKPSSLGGLTMVSSIAHVWFNAYFEGNGPEQEGRPDESGVFVVDWDALDGIKGSSQRGTRAADRIAVMWRFAKDEPATEDTARTAQDDEKDVVPQMRPADWRGSEPEEDNASDRHLGLRKQEPYSASISQASSVQSVVDAAAKRGSSSEDGEDKKKQTEEEEGVRSSGPNGEDLVDAKGS